MSGADGEVLAPGTGVPIPIGADAIAIGEAVGQGGAFCIIPDASVGAPPGGLASWVMPAAGHGEFAGFMLGIPFDAARFMPGMPFEFGGNPAAGLCANPALGLLGPPRPIPLIPDCAAFPSRCIAVSSSPANVCSVFD